MWDYKGTVVDGVNEDRTKTKYSNANYDESLFDDILKKDN